MTPTSLARRSSDETRRWPCGALLPRLVVVDGLVYERARWSFPYAGVVAQYREVSRLASGHLKVLPNGRYSVDHRDAFNPDVGGAAGLLGHALADVLKL